MAMASAPRGPAPASRSWRSAARTRRTRALAEQHAAAAYARLDEFLAHRPMEAVVIGSPSGLHAEQGIAAAERGLHVLVEKPIDVRGDRAEALVAAAARAGVTLGVIFQDRAKPALAKLRDALRQGALGEMLIASASVKWYRPPEIQDFAEAIRTGRAPLCDGRDGAASLAVVEAIYAAGRQRGVEVRGPTATTDERT